MSLLFIEGFDDGLMGTSGVPLGKWTEVNGNNSGVHADFGRNGIGFRGGASLGGSYVWMIKNHISDSHDTWIVGIAVREKANDHFDNDAGASTISFRSVADGVIHLGVGLGAQHRIRAIHGDDTVLGVSAIDTWASDAWNHLEVKVVIHDTAGSVVARLNGTTVLNLTSQDTRNGGTLAEVDAIGHGGHRLLQTEMDDIHHLNGAGSAPHNDFLNDARVIPLFPDGNGNYSNLTGSDADQTDNYLQVDENPIPVTTDYNGSGTPGDEDTYTLDNHGVAAGTVHGIQVINYATKSDTGTIGGRNIIRTNSLDFVGSDQNMTLSHVPVRTVWEDNPDTTSLWTLSEIDALEAGFEVRP